MKHYFIENPVSGKNNKIDVMKDCVVPAVEKRGVDYEIYETTGPGDCTRFVREKCEAAAGEPVRFYAVGGDGTLYEVVNGAYGFDNVEITVVPKGSGNDYIRLYGTNDQFLNVENLIDGIPLQVDCLKVTDQDGREEIAINQASMGFDAEACNKQSAMKSLPGVIGHMTYVFGGLYCMFTKTWNKFRVWVDGEEIPGPFIQATAWIGSYYGSGIKGGTFSDPTDGKVDVSIIHRYMWWPGMFRLMMFHWQQKFDFYRFSVSDYYRGEKMVVESDKPMAVNVDGECRPVTKCTFEVVPDAFTFILPNDTTFFADIQSGKTSYEIDQGPKCEEPAKSKKNKSYWFHRLVNQKLLGYGTKRT
ncbi:MAG: hypothetical protein IJ133_07130 [Clostridia bacterium]|nr:hypothetical protein [Clostridia bacterium]